MLNIILNSTNLMNERRYSTIFGLTNENMHGLEPILNDLKYDDSTYLGIAGSGELALKVMETGCKNLTLFDINTNAIAYCILIFKLIECPEITYEEFIDFLGFNNTLTTKESVITRTDKRITTYNKIAPYLPPEVKELWDIQYSIKKDETHPISLVRNERVKSIKHPMLEKDTFYKLREIFSQNDLTIKFILSSFEELPGHISNGNHFNIIYLSNIYDWITNHEMFWQVVKTFREMSDIIITRVGIYGIISGALIEDLQKIFEIPPAYTTEATDDMTIYEVMPKTFKKIEKSHN